MLQQQAAGEHVVLGGVEVEVPPGQVSRDPVAGERLHLHDPDRPGGGDDSLLPTAFHPGDGADQLGVDADLAGGVGDQRADPSQPPGDVQDRALVESGVDADAVGAGECGGVDTELAGDLEQAVTVLDRVGLGVGGGASVPGQADRRVRDAQQLADPDEARIGDAVGVDERGHRGPVAKGDRRQRVAGTDDVRRRDVVRQVLQRE